MAIGHDSGGGGGAGGSAPPSSDIPDYGRMSPMDEALWFTQPITTFFSINPGNNLQLCQPNARRTALLIGTANANPCWVSPVPNMQGLAINLIQGFAITQGNPFIIVQSALGNLVQIEWWGACQSAGAVTTGVVVEVFLREWPRPKRNGKCVPQDSQLIPSQLSQTPTWLSLNRQTEYGYASILPMVERLQSQTNQLQRWVQAGLLAKENTT